MKTRKVYTKEFKKNAVEYSIREKNKSSQEIADDLGITSNLLSKWRCAYKKHNEKAFTGHGNPRDEEMFKLKKKLAKLEEENEILKKVAAIFSREEK